QDELGAMRFVDTNAEAAGRLVHDATRALGVPVTPEAAKALFLALATDTGWFRHSSVTPRTFDLAEELVRAGAEPTPTYDAVYGTSTLARMRLTGKALERMKSEAGGRIGHTPVPLAGHAAPGGPGGEGCGPAGHGGPDQLSAGRGRCGDRSRLHRAARRRHEGQLSRQGPSRRRPPGRAIRRRRPPDGLRGDHRPAARRGPG